jgi:predicted nucleotide-binding protein
MKAKKSDAATAQASGDKRKYLKQADVPSSSLDDALKVAIAIRDHYGAKPTIPLRVAKALNLEPGASPFRMLCGASIAYGLTDGGYNAETISILQLGLRIVKPKKEGDDLVARREAFLKPRVIREFLTQYEGSPIPRDDIAHNVLEDMGVPKEKCGFVLGIITDGAKSLGLVEEIKGKTYVSAGPVETATTDAGDLPPDEAEGTDSPPPTEAAKKPATEELPKPPTPPPALTRRVFITHGKNKAFLEPLKKLLGFGEMEPVIAAERQSVSQPVPDKVMNDMRSCGAAIIHVDDEQKLMDTSAKEHIVLNQNVLIEIGAAMALYGRRFILVVKEGITLPSNLQGLYEVRYSGDTLDGNATIRLMEAINDIKNHPLPGRDVTDTNG